MPFWTRLESNDELFQKIVGKLDNAIAVFPKEPSPDADLSAPARQIFFESRSAFSELSALSIFGFEQVPALCAILRERLENAIGLFQVAGTQQDVPLMQEWLETIMNKRLPSLSTGLQSLDDLCPDSPSVPAGTDSH